MRGFDRKNAEKGSYKAARKDTILTLGIYFLGYRR